MSDECLTLSVLVSRQIDEYVATSKAAIQEHTTLHVETLRGLKVEKSELEKKIAEERDRERKMLAGEISLYHRDS